jgi:hypothetical protein
MFAIKIVVWGQVFSNPNGHFAGTYHVQRVSAKYGVKDDFAFLWEHAIFRRWHTAIPKTAIPKAAIPKTAIPKAAIPKINIVIMISPTFR